MIRAARSDELAALTQLARRSKAHWGYSAEFMAACASELTVTLELLPHTFVCEADDEVVGFYSLSEARAHEAELMFLFVEPHAIGRGYGRELLAHARCHALHAGWATISIQGDPHAAEFYAALGATRIGERASESIPGRMLPLYVLASGD